MSTFRAPSGSCDTHCHLIGPRTLFPFTPTRAGDLAADATKAMLAAMHQRLGIERAVIVQSGLHGTDPSVTLDAIATSQGRYRGVALVEPGIRDRELEALHAGGIRGIRLNFVSYPDGPPNPADLVRTLPTEPPTWNGTSCCICVRSRFRLCQGSSASSAFLSCSITWAASIPRAARASLPSSGCWNFLRTEIPG
jgi:Amidohydrolase